MRTETAGPYLDGAPDILPGRPTLNHDKTQIVRLITPDDGLSNRRGRINRERVLEHAHPYDQVNAIIYSPEELAAAGFTGVDTPHALFDFRYGQAELVPERRNPDRVTRETAEDLGMVLNDEDQSDQYEHDLAGASLRLKIHMQKMVTAIIAAYEREMGAVLQEEQEISDEDIGILFDQIGKFTGEPFHKIKVRITREGLADLLRNSARQTRERDFVGFNREDNFEWEDCACAAFGKVLDKGTFDFSPYLGNELLQASPIITIRLDENPNHTVTLKFFKRIEAGSSSWTFHFALDHESGVSIAHRIASRPRPETSGSERVAGAGAGGPRRTGSMR